MTTTVIMLIAIIALITFIASIIIKRHNLENDPKDKAINIAYAKKQVLTDPEQTLYFRLIETLDDCIVITQVQMSSFLSVTNTGKGRQSALNRILQKSVDFLVCNKDFSVIAAIELQDNSHRRQNRQRNDEFKRDVLSAVKIPFIEFNVKQLPTAEEIRSAIQVG